MIILEILFWASLGAILWTHVGYPLFVAALAVVRRMRVAKADIAPSVAVVIAAHNEERVIERLVESLLAQDYPGGLEVVVASDASTDGMDALVERLAERDGRVRLVRCPRGGKVAAQNQAVRTVEAEVVAFADAGAVWEPDALRKLVRSLADPTIGYVAGKVSFGEPEGTNREGSTGATSSGSAGASRRPARSRAGTAPSTPCAAPTTSRSTRASDTTSPSPT